MCVWGPHEAAAVAAVAARVRVGAERSETAPHVGPAAGPMRTGRVVGSRARRALPPPAQRAAASPPRRASRPP